MKFAADKIIEKLLNNEEGQVSDTKQSGFLDKLEASKK